MKFYRSILKRAFLISWYYKFLWFFGLFAVLLGSGGEYEVLSQVGSAKDSFLNTWHRLNEIGLFRKQTLFNIGKIITHQPIAALIIFLLFTALALLFALLVWLVITSQAAIVYTSGSIAGRKKVDFRHSIEAGVNYFWPTLALNFFNKILIYFLFSLIFIIFYHFLSLKGFLAIVVYTLTLAAGLIISFVIKYAIGFVIIKKKPLLTSLSEALKLFLANWLVSIEMALLLFVVGWLGMILTTFLIFVLAAPFSLLLSTAAYIPFLAGKMLILIFIFLLLLAIIFWAGAFWTVFQISAWTILFIELVSQGGQSKLVRIFSRHKTITRPKQNQTDF